MAILFYILILFLIILVFWGMEKSEGLEEIRINIKTEKVNNEFMLLAISDLHSQLKDEDMEFLKRKIEEYRHIALVGDIFDDIADSKVTYEFVEYLYQRKKKLYFVLGNHEARHKDLGRIQDFMKKRSKMLDVRNSPIKLEEVDIYGLNDAKINEEDFFESLEIYKEKMDKNKYNILLSHRPEYFKTYVDTGFDLVISGHAHGGQIRLAGRGLYAPGQGFFPKYSKGIYEEGKTKMILMSGATSKRYIVPRLFNKPNFATIHIGKGGKHESNFI